MGGILGVLLLGILIVFSRYTRIPLALLLNLLPFLLPFFKRAHAQPPAPITMDKDEARLILGLTAQATEAEIREAHRRLIQKNHPDMGGSDYLAARINQARDVLLK